MEEEEEQLLCRDDPQVTLCAPDHTPDAAGSAPQSGPVSVPPVQSAEQCALDDAADDMIMSPPPPLWDMRQDVRPHPPMLDLPEEPQQAEPEVAPPPPQLSPEELARREAAWRAEEERETVRLEAEERRAEAEQRWRDERDRREAEDNPILDDAAIERDFSIDDDRRGRGPDGFDLRSRDGAYVYGEATERGGTFGLGIGHERGDIVDVDGPSAHVGYGEWYDQDGRRYRGVRANGGIFNFGAHSAEQGDPTSGSLTGPSFDIGAYDDGETFTLGAQAGIVETGFTVGNTADDHSDSDTSFSASGGVGPGGAVRLHHGDADGDGIEEAGFGVSAFDVGFDIRSEYLGQLVNVIEGTTPAERRARQARDTGAQRPID